MHSNEKAGRYWDAFYARQEAGGQDAELKQDLMTGMFPWHRDLMGRTHGKLLPEEGLTSLRWVTRDSTPDMEVATSRAPQARAIRATGPISNRLAPQAADNASTPGSAIFHRRCGYDRLFGRMYPATSGRRHIAAIG